MKLNELDRLIYNLVNKFGLPLKGSQETAPEGQTIVLTPDGIHPNEGFKVTIKIGWRSLSIEFVPGKYAADLIEQMSKAPKSNLDIFASIANQIINQRGTIILKINDLVVIPTDPITWPPKWRSFNFSLITPPIEINTDENSITEKQINTWVERYLSCLLQLTPIEEIIENDETAGLPEGAMTLIAVNRFERSRHNRAVCLNFHGTICKVCGMDFAKTYGPIGDGYIHVHHIIPVSQLGPGYIINPIKDLVPVCPNCHSMLHTSDPPLTVEALKRHLQNL